MIISFLWLGGTSHEEKQTKNAFEERFSEELVDMIAVTGPSGVGAGKAGKESLWTASIPLIAWKEKGRITTEKVRLCWLTDEEGLREKQAQLHKESIITLQVRKGTGEFMLQIASEEKSRFMIGDNGTMYFYYDKETKEWLMHWDCF
ncbi:DUF7021 domain-containing protein [Bacillus sp. A015]